MFPETVTVATPAVFDRARSRATLRSALQEVAARVAAAVDGRRVVPSEGRRALEQLAKAVELTRTGSGPLPALPLLVHLTAARTFLTDGWAPQPLLAELTVAIARVHHLARTAPAVVH